MNESYYPVSQIFKKNEPTVVKQAPPVQQEPSVPKEELVQVEQPNDTTESKTVFYSCLSDVSGDVASVAEEVLSSSVTCLQDSTPIPPEIKEFQITIVKLQEMEMFKNTATVSFFFSIIQVIIFIFIFSF